MNYNKTPAKGHADHSTHKSWSNMIRRCCDPRVREWKYYGGRGITVCDRWFQFSNFIADMGRRPEGMSIDRVDSEGNYEPANCRWACAKLQATNRNRRIPYMTYEHAKKAALIRVMFESSSACPEVGLQLIDAIVASGKVRKIAALAGVGIDSAGLLYEMSPRDVNALFAQAKGGAA